MPSHFRQWKDFDYRAITAGTIITLLSVIMWMALPRRAFECDRNRGTCLLTQGNAVSHSSRAIPIDQLSSPSTRCATSTSNSTCDYEINVLVTGKRQTILTQIDRAERAEQLAHSIDNYIQDPVVTRLHLKTSGDQRWPLGASALGLTMLVLGIWKNRIA